MNKKIIVSVITSLMMAQSAFAFCDYNDLITFGGTAQMKVVSVTTSGNIQAYKASADKIIIDTPSIDNACNYAAGVATVKLASQSGSTCQMEIKDGSDEWDPSVLNVHCTNGVHYSSFSKASYHRYNVVLDK